MGDDAQSIYAFRGARIENILNFTNDFPEAKEYRLEQNYRSTQNVVNAANSLIKHNSRRMRKECFARSEPGEKIDLLGAYTDAEEAFQVVSSILNKVYTSRAGYGEFAILYRTNAQSRLLEEALRKRNIPYKVYGGFSFYERAEVKDLMAYMRLVVNPNDEEAFRRAVAIPSRGIGDVSLQKLGTAALFAGLSSFGYIQQGDLEAAGLRGNIAGRLKAFAELIETVRSMQDEGANAYQVAMEVARLSGYLHMLKEDKSIEGMSKLDNVEELLNSIQVYCGVAAEGVELETEVTVPDNGEIAPSLERFLNNVTLLTQMDEQEQPENERVSLMTVHSAKGLEFSHIYVVGMEEKLFPSLLSSNTQAELEEERRLFYVAMTRAKKSLTLSFSRTRMHWGSMESNPPSRFLREIDPNFLNQPVPDAFGAGAEGQDGRNSWSRGRSSWSNDGRFGSEGGNTWAGKRDSYRAQQTGSKSAGPIGKNHPGIPSDRPGGQGFKAAGAMGRESFKAAGGASGREGISAPGDNSGREDFQPADASSLTVGMDIEHDRFGRGRILSMEGEMPNTRAVIEFEFGGAKTLLLKFARLRIL